MTPASLPISTIARFAKDGQVYRSFGFFLAAGGGSILAVPVGLATGDFTGVIDRSPVPYYEVLAAIEPPVQGDLLPISPEDLARDLPLVAALFSPYGWGQDSISLNAGQDPLPRVVSPDGVIFCWVPTN